ncbi:MAG: hypothetical protein U1E28_22825 [Beijerinckiaceae bacterium]
MPRVPFDVARNFRRGKTPEETAGLYDVKPLKPVRWDLGSILAMAFAAGVIVIALHRNGVI